LSAATWARRGGYALLFAAPLGFFGFQHRNNDDALFLPGRTSDGHHQIEQQCTACHSPLSGVNEESCLRCHGASLRARNDSHAPSKFEDPGRADQLAVVDARSCLPCHREHRAEARVRGSVTVAATFCFDCHQQIASERPSHAGLPADGCASSGCHNYHDNRALYQDFLVKHRKDPPLLARPRIPFLPTGHARPAFSAAPRPVVPEADVPAGVRSQGDVVGPTVEWTASAHARAGANCTACHQSLAAPPGSTALKGGGQWQWTVDDVVCASCHGDEQEGFNEGKHGMRQAVGLAAMGPALARAAMRDEASNKRLRCTSCHTAHRFDRMRAAVDSCESCHADDHTRAYRQSPHFTAWQKEQQGVAPEGSGVSCATCHLPRHQVRVAGKEEVRVQHNQNHNLRPNDKMVREVCAHCHGVGFSLAALADPAMVARNFQGAPVAVRTGMSLINEGEHKDGRKPR
jgi:predicted CXXCH cytochrome family protein